MKSKTLLIAYQDDLRNRSLTTLFRSAGYRIETTRAISEMIRKIRKGNIHVILIDDEIEGVKTCDIVPLLKNINAKIQIIVISSEESIELAKRLRGAGIFYQAMKPVDLVEVKSAVECAFGKIERENLKESVFSFLAPEMVPG
jgi:DNA-binding NtrC family response regulator